jgi:hypothetical protein
MRWRKFKCWLRHRRFWSAEPIYHSYLMRCDKCGRAWIDHDYLTNTEFPSAVPSQTQNTEAG